MENDRFRPWLRLLSDDPDPSPGADAMAAKGTGGLKHKNFLTQIILPGGRLSVSQTRQ